MATIGVQLRNEANNTNLGWLDAFAVEFQKRRNADPGSGTFRLMKADPAVLSTVTYGSLVLFTVTPDDETVPTVAWPARVTDISFNPVSEGDEGVESVEFRCAGLLIDWSRASVLPPQADLVPSMDERIFHWSAADYQGDIIALSTGPSAIWDEASVVAFQGWDSPFYTGQPAGWTDPFAAYLWGDPTESPSYNPALHSNPMENAPPGKCLFWTTFPVQPGRYYVEWAADNRGIFYLNGRRVQEGDNFRKKQQFEFEVSGGSGAFGTNYGFINFAWEVENGPDGGPVGGNPAGLIFSVRVGDPATGDVVYSSTPGTWNLGFPVWVRSYPSTIPQFRTGGILRRLKDAAGLAPAQLTDWTIPGTLSLDANGNAYPLVDTLGFRLHDDNLLDVLGTLCQSWLDCKVANTGKTLRLYAKGTDSSPAPVTLVTGESTAGQANPASVNVLDLSWDGAETVVDRLALRWADGWVEVGAAPGAATRRASYRAEQIGDAATATAIATELLNLFGATRVRASFKYLPLDETTDLPLAAFDVGDTIDVPLGIGDTVIDGRIVQAVTYSGNDEGRVESIVIEAGDPVTETLEAFEDSIRRGAPGQLGGRAKGASPTSGKAAYGQFDRMKVSTPSVGSPVHVIASAPDAASGLTSTAPAPFVGRVVSLRLIGQGGNSGTSTVTVSDGVTTWTLSGNTANGMVASVLADRDPGPALVPAVWTTQTQVTVTIVTANHAALHVYADVADVR